MLCLILFDGCRGTANLDKPAWREKLDFYADALAATSDGVFIAGQPDEVNSLSSGYATLYKFNRDGKREWMHTTKPGRDGSGFRAVAADRDGNAVAVGAQWGRALYHFGSIALQGGGDRSNALIVKYTAQGEIAWAHAAQGMGLGESVFYSVATDRNGNIYAAGFHQGTARYTIAGLSALGRSAGAHAMIIKFTPEGKAEWLQSASDEDGSSFDAITTDSSDNLFACGRQQGSHTFRLGGQTGYAETDVSWEESAIVAKLDEKGSVAWVTVSKGSFATVSCSVVADNSGGVFYFGTNRGQRSLNLGGHSVSPGEFAGRLNAQGSASWLKNTGTKGRESTFQITGSKGQLYLAGAIAGEGPGCAALRRLDSDGTQQAQSDYKHCSEPPAFENADASRSGVVYVSGKEAAAGSYSGRGKSWLVQYR